MELGPETMACNGCIAINNNGQFSSPRHSDHPLLPSPPPPPPLSSPPARERKKTNELAVDAAHRARRPPLHRRGLERTKKVIKVSITPISRLCSPICNQTSRSRFCMCVRVVVCAGGRKTSPPTTPSSHIEQVTNTCEAIPGSFPRRTRRVRGRKGLRDRQLRSVPGNARWPEARTFKTPRLLETDAGGSARGLVRETSVQVPRDASVYLGECGWCVQEGPGGQEGWVRDLHVFLCTFPGVWGKRVARIPGARRSILAEGSL